MMKTILIMKALKLLIDNINDEGTEITNRQYY